MDNDSKFKHKLANIYRHWRFKIQYRGRKIYYNEEGNDFLLKELNDAIENSKPYLVGRFGATEARAINCYLKGKKYPNYLKERLTNLSGVFNHSNKEIDEFAKEYFSSFYNVDILVTWSVKACGWLNRKLCNNAKNINFYAIEPWFYKNPWTKTLENKRVLIIHPFIETMKMQYEKRGGLFKNNCLPTFEQISFIKAVQSSANEKTNFNTWIEALDFMKEEIDNVDFDVAILGCGAYAMPLGSYIKDKGKIAIIMAGVTQLLFGIKGNRWDSQIQYTNLYNDLWVRPNENETPNKKSVVEGGSYW